MTIKQKLVAAFLFLLILPSVCLQLWSYKEMSGIMVERICEAEQQSITSAMKETQNLFTEMGNILVWLVADKDAQQLMQAEVDNCGEVETQFRYQQMKKSEMVLNRIQLLLMKYPFEILLVPRQGNAYGNRENIPLSTENIRSKSWWNERLCVQDNLIYWGNDVEETHTKNDGHYFFAALPVRSVEHPKEINAIAYIRIYEKYIAQMLAQVNARGEVYLIDKNDKIVSTTDKRDLLQSIRKLTDIPMEFGEKGWCETTQNGKPTIAVHVRQPMGKWSMLTFTPSEQIFGRLRDTQNRLLLFTLVIIVLFMGAGLFIANLISNPIVRLSKIVKRVEQGDFTARVPEHSKGEIGLLERNFNQMIERLVANIKEMRIQEQRKREAEIDALQAQINPHFLFNVLSSIRWASKDEKIEKMVISLCTLLKASMRKGGNVISLGEECALLVQYIELNNLRHLGEVHFYDEIPAELRQLRIPRFILQPLIENAILHGFEYKNKSGNIWLKGEKRGKHVILTVADDGMGFPENFSITQEVVSKQENHGAYSSIGISNVEERLRLYYEGNATLRCTNRLNAQNETIGAAVLVEVLCDFSPQKMNQTENKEKNDVSCIDCR